MEQKTNKSYRKPYIGMKLVAGKKGVFNHTILITGFRGKDALLTSSPYISDTITRMRIKEIEKAIKDGFWAELIEFKDYYEAIQKRAESNL